MAVYSAKVHGDKELLVCASVQKKSRQQAYKLGAEGYAGLRRKEKVQGTWGGRGNKSQVAQQYKDPVRSSCAPSDMSGNGKS